MEIIVYVGHTSPIESIFHTFNIAWFLKRCIRVASVVYCNKMF